MYLPCVQVEQHSVTRGVVTKDWDSEHIAQLHNTYCRHQSLEAINERPQRRLAPTETLSAN